VDNTTGNYNKIGTTAVVAFLIKITEKNRFFACSVNWIGVRNYSKLFIMKDVRMHLLSITGNVNTISIQTSGFKQIFKSLSISAKHFEAVSRITNNVRRMRTQSICVTKALFTSFLFTSSPVFYSMLMLTEIPHLGWNQS